MVIVMDMSSGSRLEGFGAYEDEVLSANWLPPPELGLQLQSVRPTTSPCPPPMDVDAFLRTIYRSQE